MCIICEMKKQAVNGDAQSFGEFLHKALERARAERDQRAAEAGAPGETAGPIVAQEDDLYTQSVIHLNNASAIERLTDAADRLMALGYSALAERTLLALENMLPKSADQEQPAAPVGDAELPEELTDLVKQMRAQGFEVEAVRIPL